MIKKQYLLELNTETPLIKSGQQGKDVQKVQEWINLWKRVDPLWKLSLVMDGDFGPVSASAVKSFQQHHGLAVDGIVGNITWRKLTEPMKNAYTRIDGEGSLRKLVVAYARQHLAASPREFNQNEGTWVRAYMDGNEGTKWPWCMGFAQMVVDQATFTLEQRFTDLLPASYSCDVVGSYGLNQGKLIENAALRKKSIEEGDLFLNVRIPKADWTHVGIITGVDGDWIETIEGNTNDEGSREGYEVCARRRNYKLKKIDVFKLL
ncbi:MAG: peptidoglycan-binding domain-containing protein [Bacteroidota bacterium]